MSQRTRGHALCVNGEAMPKDIARLLQEIAAASSAGELTAITAEIDLSNFDEQELAQLIDAIREARERLSTP